MAETSSIEWTDATWNPITGCSVVSPGCTHCYAMKMAGTRLQWHPSRAGLTVDSKAGPVWTGEVRLNEDWIDQPLRWKRGRRIFVCAHGDLFHEKVPDEWIDRVFAVMALAPQHVFQVLTKRPERMRAWFERYDAAHDHNCADHVADQMAVLLGVPGARGGARTGDHDWDWPLRNVWLGVSVEDQQRANERIPDLLATPAAVRFLSCEPLLGPVDLTYIDLAQSEAREKEPSGLTDLDALTGVHSDEENGGIPGIYGYPDPHIDWVIVGGESGPKARPMHPAWARSLRDQCAAAGVPFFFKQWGAWAPFHEVPPNAKGWRILDDQGMARVGKKAAGHLLDGVEHHHFPARLPEQSEARREPLYV